MNRRPHPVPALLAATIVLLTLTTPASATNPDPNSGDPFAQNQLLQIVWSSTDPPPSAWMQTPIALGSDAAEQTSGTAPTYAKNPTFSTSSGTDGTIKYLSYDEADAQGICPSGSSPLACTVHHGSTNVWKMAFVVAGQVYAGYTVKWCDKPNTTGTCWDVERVAVHEFGHVLDLAHNPTNDTSNTVMYVTTPSKANTGGATHVYKSCDRASLQMLYDVNASSSGYADCLKNAVNAGTNGLRTAVTFSPSATFVCINDPVTFSGRLDIQSYSSYGLLSGQDLGSRTIDIERSSPGVGSYSYWTSDSTSSTGDWSMSLSFSVSTNYDWRSQRNSETGLDADTSTGVNVRWSTSC